MSITNVIRTHEGGARLLLNGMPTEFSPADVDALLRALVEPPPEPKPLDVRVGDWVRRHDDILCRVVRIRDGLATLRACDDCEDEEVCGAWAFRVVERLPKGWTWWKRPVGGCFYLDAQGIPVAHADGTWRWDRYRSGRITPVPLPDLTHDLTDSPQDTLTVLRHVEEILGV